MVGGVGPGRSRASRIACGIAPSVRKKPPTHGGSAVSGDAGRRPYPEPTTSSGSGSVGSIRRLLEIATIDVLGLENSIVRSRTLISAALAAAKLLETGELEERIATLEAAVGVSREPRGDDLLSDDAA